MVRGQRKPGGKWTARDRALLLALQAYEDDLCPGCGTPRTYGMDDDAEGRYSSPAVTCHGCVAKQRAQSKQNPPPGEYHYVKPDVGIAFAMTHPIHVQPFPK